MGLTSWIGLTSLIDLASELGCLENSTTGLVLVFVSLTGSIIDLGGSWLKVISEWLTLDIGSLSL